MTTDVQLEWGHKVLNPGGQEIRLPAKAIVQLRRLGLIEKRRGLPQISSFIYTLLDPEYDPLTMGLREIIGADVSGPETCICKCLQCKRERELIYRELEQLGLFQLDMARHRQQSAE
jgi:hypothetical protein